jgi:hypothetical protein
VERCVSLIPYIKAWQLCAERCASLTGVLQLKVFYWQKKLLLVIKFVY